jgi:hypothetical protein
MFWTSRLSLHGFPQQLSQKCRGGGEFPQDGRKKESTGWADRSEISEAETLKQKSSD